MAAGETPVDGITPHEVSLKVGEPIDLSQLPTSSPIFADQSWHEAWEAIFQAGVAGINPVHLIVGETPDSPSGPRMRKIGEDPSEGIITVLANPTLEVLPVGERKFYDVESGEEDAESSDDSEPNDSGEAHVYNEVGLYRVDKGALQAAIAIIIEHSTEVAYILGRLDQASVGTDRESFVDAADLPDVASHVEWLATFPARGEHGERAQRIIEEAAQRAGGLASALEIQKPE